ncbi:MAG: cupredoxin domain-containing protein [Nitrospiraceae bacterium]
MRRAVRTLILTCAVAAGTLSAGSWTTSPVGPTAAQAQGPELQRIEIVMDAFSFVLPKPVALQLGVPTAFILRNRDIVRHGFTAPALSSVPLSVEGEGVVAYGKGVEGVYVDPGKTVVLYLTPERGGNYTFRCDLHQQMKGELLTLDLPAA